MKRFTFSLIALTLLSMAAYAGQSVKVYVLPGTTSSNLDAFTVAGDENDKSPNSTATTTLHISGSATISGLKHIHAEEIIDKRHVVLEKDEEHSANAISDNQIDIIEEKEPSGFFVRSTQSDDFTTKYSPSKTPGSSHLTTGSNLLRGIVPTTTTSKKTAELKVFQNNLGFLYLFPRKTINSAVPSYLQSEWVNHTALHVFSLPPPFLV